MISRETQAAWHPPTGLLLRGNHDPENYRQIEHGGVQEAAGHNLRVRSRQLAGVIEQERSRHAHTGAVEPASAIQDCEIQDGQHGREHEQDRKANNLRRE